MLSAAKLAGEPHHKQVEALKYIAFSYRVTGRPDQCRHAFEMAFQADPHFAPAPGEAGHLVWAPVFNQARRADQDVRTQARHAKESARTEASSAEKRVHQTEQIRSMERWQTR